MDALRSAAAALEAESDGDDDGAIDDEYDPARGELPSDGEDGPDEHDDAEDARAPDEEVEGEEGADAEPQVAEEVTTAPTPPEQSPEVRALVVPALKEHLMWRGVKPVGLKAALQEKLREVIATPVSMEVYVEAGGNRVAAAQPAGGAAPKVTWKKIDPSEINRPVFTGPDGRFVPKAALGWTPATHPFNFMDAFYTKEVRDLEVENSKRYRGWIKAMHTEIYAGAADPTTRTNSLAHAVLIIQGLNPVPDQRRMFQRSFAFKGHRGGDLLTKSEWTSWKAFFHISHPGQAPTFGTKEWDELHKIRPMLDDYLRHCVANVEAGCTFSIDEITIGFQGHHSRLKQRCGKFKRAGDGFQACSVPPLCMYFQISSHTFYNIRSEAPNAYRVRSASAVYYPPPAPCHLV